MPRKMMGKYRIANFHFEKRIKGVLSKYNWVDDFAKPLHLYFSFLLHSNSTRFSEADNFNGILLQETIWLSATGSSLGCQFYSLANVFRINFINISAKDLSTLTCPQWFSALISRLANSLTYLNVNSDLTCRPIAVSNLYVSSATLPHEELTHGLASLELSNALRQWRK